MKKQQCSDEKLGRLIADYALGILNESTALIVKRHLAECSACSNAVKDMRWMAAGVRSQPHDASIEHIDIDVLCAFTDEPESLDRLTRETIDLHLALCDRCRAEYGILRELNDHLGQLQSQGIRDHISALTRREQAGLVIPVIPITTTPPESEFLLAAAGETARPSRVHNLTTLYSEDPAVVLRVMRDPKRGYDYLQLISSDKAFVSQVLVQLPDLDRTFLTNETGFAQLEEGLAERISGERCQIKLPEAVFELEPLVFDADAVEYSKQVMLETPRGDRVEITFEGKTVGKQITLRVLELSGSTEFSSVRVVVSQRDSSTVAAAAPNESLTFNLEDPDDLINVRLFQG